MHTPPNLNTTTTNDCQDTSSYSKGLFQERFAQNKIDFFSKVLNWIIYNKYWAPTWVQNTSYDRYSLSVNQENTFRWALSIFIYNTFENFLWYPHRKMEIHAMNGNITGQACNWIIKGKISRQGLKK